MYPTVEPTYKLILMVVKALLEEDAPAKAVLAAIGAMEDTITEAEKNARVLIGNPIFHMNDDGDVIR